MDLNPKEPQSCLCGCGTITTKRKGAGFYNRFIKGHENRGRVSWNRGGPFPLETRRKMSLARLGKEPANKAQIDLRELRRLYVQEKKNAREVGRELNISLDSIKNRLRKLGWSRTTKESCSAETFKEEMRRIRIKTLTSQPVIASPNKLEDLVYRALDTLGITYQRQIPLFEKFVVDVLIPERKLVIEVFGRYWHEMPKIKKKDASKKKYLEKCGYAVVELWDFDIKKFGPEALLKNILQTYSVKTHGESYSSL